MKSTESNSSVKRRPCYFISCVFGFVTEFDEIFAEFELGEKAAILRIGRPLERRERDEQVMLGRVDDHVTLLAAVATNQRSFGIQPVVDVDSV